MTGDRARYGIEVEPEVRTWLRGCSLAEYRAAERAADRLAEDGELLPFPLASHLGGPCGNCGSGRTGSRTGSPPGEGLCS
ncbi:hypothetical protein [Kitasatospora sp. NPDC101183]|uniref:hypothetical protein n=1 Tax=Kitasatospora sp. NPDC101183 TaxID=3364100 RepID=UPI0037F6C2D9